MITLTLADRSHPLLGNVVVERTPIQGPLDVAAHFEPSRLGRCIQALWRQIPQCCPQVTPLYLQLMEEHLHGIIQAKEYLSKPIGHVIGSFKGDCTQAYRKEFGISNVSLFSPGYQDTILFQDGQLDRMFNYVKDNPRRLAIKRLFPDLFRVMQRIPFGGGHLNGIGNLFLLQAPRFYQIQASRRISREDLEAKKQELLQAISMRCVIVSPCLSAGEKKLARLAFEQQAPLIVLQNRAFSPYYKPPGRYFDACAAGRLLILAPPCFGNQPGKHPLTRMDACILNRIAQFICGQDAVPIHYQGLVPAELDRLAANALCAFSPDSLEKHTEMV
ncbi:MAG: hypothetical protein IJJ33_11380 [Victivallales bacterium]|nr:hypothetical protein [Victivallales bacterium]